MSRISGSIIIGLSSVLFACGGGRPKLTVSVEGDGSVVSAPAGINCGAGLQDCVFEFEPGVTVILSAEPNEGYVFAGWSGVCSGNAECEILIDKKMDVAAEFVASGGDVLPPSAAFGTLNAVDMNELSISWEPSTDDITPPSQLIYRVYISSDRDALLEERNLIDQRTGGDELSTGLFDVQPNTEYYAAIVAVDGSLNESPPYISSAVTPVETPSVRDDVITYLSTDEGWGVPSASEVDGLYRFEFSSDLDTPEIGAYIAFPVEDVEDGHLISAVTSVDSSNGVTIVTARPALIFEVSDDVRIQASLSGTINTGGMVRITTPEAAELAKKKKQPL